ncbi:hypothetical protein [Cellulomonas fengjieae]|uniref:Lipoprotein n=1 Tax=Cellulomonas fengjieae TaxID=2819978 RepID=A0ABS3SBI0_9CELL|nr:hypothetical protein [Cellulomonas fengjieae]MBO3083108.1 hypothetical protein [Cellulomonas fengjieae]QVI65527.1 hypothetical protein KG102_15720 [Cellulomonas fengjieae]
MIRRAGLVLALLIGLTGVTACGSVDAGSEAGDQFEEWMAGTEHVEGFDMRSNNDLPWVGTLWAGVVVDPDATIEQMVEVARRATSFESRAAATFSIGYTRGDFTTRFPVFPDAAAANRAMITLAHDVDRSTAATELYVGEASRADDADVMVTSPDVLADFDGLRTRLSAKGLRAGDVLAVRDVDGAFSITADRSTGAAAARAAYEAVLAAYPVTEAHLTDTGLDLRVDVAETPAVLALAQQAAPGISVSVQFGVVTKTGTGDYTAADALVAELSAAGPVLGAVLSPELARVTVPDLATAWAMFAAVGDGPLYDGVILRIETADEQFSISSSAEPLTAYRPVLDALSAPAWAALLTAVDLDANALDVRTQDLTDAQVGDLARALASTPAGTVIEVRPGSGIGFRFVATAGLTAAALDPFGDPSAEEADTLAAFVSGWNAA